MIKTSLLIALVATASLINAQQTGVITVNVNTTTTFNGSVSDVDQETLALNYTIGEIGNEEFSWNNEWYAEESGVNEFELLDGAGDIIYLVPSGPADQNKDVDEILSSPATSPNGDNSTVGSYVGNALTKAYQPNQANDQSQTVLVANAAPVANQEVQQEPLVVNAIAPVLVADPPRPVLIAVQAPALEVPEAIVEVSEVAVEAPEAAEVVENSSEVVTVSSAPVQVPVLPEASAEAAENVAESVNEVPEVAVEAPEAAEVVESSSEVVTVSSAPVQVPVLPEAPAEAAENVAENVNEAANEVAENVSDVVSDVEQVYENVENDVGEAASAVANDVEESVQAVENDASEASNAAENVVVSYSSSYNYSSSGNQ